MFLPESLAEHLEQLNPLEKASRERWADVCAEVLLRVTPREGVRAMVAGGLLRFIGAAKPHFGVHAFKHQDYARMFDRLRATVASWGPPQGHA